MKSKLEEKLIELGYNTSYINDKLKDLGSILEEKLWKLEDIIFEKYDQPTEEAPRFFLNIDNLYEKIIIFDGNIYSVYKENTLNDKIQFADYSLSNKLLLIRCTKK